MPVLNMYGPFELTDKEIDRTITKISPGNYVFGFNKKNKFYVYYIGRSDKNLKDSLKKQIGEHKMFKFCYTESPKEAFEKECIDFHEFGGIKRLYNTNHPVKPNGTDFKCPVCKN